MKKFIPILFIICLISIPITVCFIKDGGTESAVVIDLDMSKMSGVMVYSQVVNIYENPKEHVGKRIKINGQYYASYYDQTKSYYHHVLVGDEASCCQIGFVFVWNGEHTYPDDYPENQARIELEGLFKSYEALGKTYYFLSVDDLHVLK